MVNSTNDIVRDQRAFEAFLVEQGYAPDRAHAIATKGFSAPSPLQAGKLDILVADIERKRHRLLVEAKSLGRIDFELEGHWSAWKRSRGITTTGPASIKLSVLNANRAVRGMAAPFDLQVRYVAPGGRRTRAQWHSNGGVHGPLGNGPYPLAVGIQEIEIRGRAPSIPQRIAVDITWA